MIPFNFAYYRPDSLTEAVSAYREAQEAGLDPVYYGGGTEIVTFCRSGSMKPGAVIDIKRIPECTALDEADGAHVFGAALALNTIIDDERWPLLAQVATIVDHTVRNRLSLGGNIAGRLPYRETVLPFLLVDSRARLAGPEGERDVALEEVFDRRLKLAPGELLVSLSVPSAVTELPWFYRRRVRKTRLDYPILTACCIKTEGRVRMATTAAYGFPLRSKAAGEIINDGSQSSQARAEAAVDADGLRIADNQRATGAYRRALLVSTISEALDVLR